MKIKPDKIYFVLYRKGYWEGLVTTNHGLAKNRASEDSSFRLIETPLIEIDFEIDDATMCGPHAAINYEVKNFRPENHMAFLAAYKAEIGENWFQTIYVSDLEKLGATGRESKDFQSDLFGVCLHIHKI